MGKMINGEQVIQHTRKALQQSRLWQNHCHFLVGVSGGVDSVALLWALHSLQEEGAFQLSACHIHHGLREETANRDEAYVRSLCARWHIPLHCYHAKLAGGMADAGAETRAREARRSFFASCMAEQTVDALLVAHHQGDQAETVLMHLLRGAGGTGAMGMEVAIPFASGCMVRPFLQLDKRTLLLAMQEIGIAHMEDESNALLCTPRNRIRHQVLPFCETIFPQAEKHLAEFAKRQAIDEAYFQQEAQTLLAKTLVDTPPIYALTVAPLQAVHEAISRRVLRAFYQKALSFLDESPSEHALSNKDTQALYQLLFAQAQATHNLPNQWIAVRGMAHLHLLRQNRTPLQAYTPPLPMPIVHQNDTFIFANESYQLCPFSTLPQGNRHEFVVLSQELLLQNPVLRTPQEGDVMRPFGKKSHRNLRRILIDGKIDLPFRDSLVVLAIGNEILWIPNVVTSESTRTHAPIYLLRRI